MLTGSSSVILFSLPYSKVTKFKSQMSALKAQLETFIFVISYRVSISRALLGRPARRRSPQRNVAGRYRTAVDNGQGSDVSGQVATPGYEHACSMYCLSPADGGTLYLSPLSPLGISFCFPPDALTLTRKWRSICAPPLPPWMLNIPLCTTRTLNVLGWNDPEKSFCFYSVQ